MTQTRQTAREIGERGEAIYDATIRSAFELRHRGEFLALDIETGDYDIGPDELETLQSLKARHPHGFAFVLRIGQRAAHRLRRETRAMNYPAEGRCAPTALRAEKQRRAYSPPGGRLAEGPSAG